jgi:hypothetical protein
MWDQSIGLFLWREVLWCKQRCIGGECYMHGKDSSMVRAVSQFWKPGTARRENRNCTRYLVRTAHHYREW